MSGKETMESLIQRVRVLLPQALRNLGDNIVASGDVDVPFDEEGASLLLWIDLFPGRVGRGFDIGVNAIVVGGRYAEVEHGEYAPADAISVWYNSTPAVIVGSLDSLVELYSLDGSVRELLRRAGNRAKRQGVAA
ncbi:hypothetical protein [Rhizobium sp. 1399]|uniref:hypothetical protein n=1 Tax=Rhizobium sp. 1399 TaxID=2817758 RepID=UPI002860AF48|nr:hypothetical protein [Rhizobium sp. 1399]MDR6664020.1 hypothetical protein [Rhizobium sp. 1399]